MSSRGFWSRSNQPRSQDAFGNASRAGLKAEVQKWTKSIGSSRLDAVAIYKSIWSRSPFRKQAREYLYVIQSTTLDGLALYTKGKFIREAGLEIYYFLISAKRAM